MSAADPTAAERARRYRQNRRAETVAGGGVVELLQRIVAELVELRRSVDNSAARDVTAPARDVTQRHALLSDAQAPARGELSAESPTGSLSASPMRDGVTALVEGAEHGRILAALDRRDAFGVRLTATVAALADACELGQQQTVRGLVELQGLGVVERIAAVDATQRDRWQLVAPKPPPIAGQIGFDERQTGFDEVQQR